MMKKYFLYLLLVVGITLLSSCIPNDIELELYTADILSAKTGQPSTSQAKFEFSIPGKDEEGMLPKVVEIVKKYIPKDSEVNQSKGNFGKILTINTTIPVVNDIEVEKYLKKNPSPFYLLIKNDKVFLNQHKETIKAINKEIRKINMMLSLDVPAKRTLFRIISDQKEPVTVSAIAIFSENKPFLIYKKEIKRRKSVELLFKGGSGSVYKELKPQFKISSKNMQVLQNTKIANLPTKNESSLNAHPLMILDRNQLKKEMFNWGANKSEDTYVELLALSEKDGKKIKEKIAEIYYIGARPMTWETAQKLAQTFKSIGDYNVEAQSNLGVMYSFGQGVKKNYDEALKWDQHAADQGDEDAKKRIKRGYGGP